MNKEPMSGKGNEVVILGGGLSGLSAGHILTKAAFKVKVIERDTEVGGLSKTVVRDGFRFDLGGHRFFTKDKKTDAFVRDLMESELVSVSRKSKIYMRSRYFDYPLKPLNAVFGLGVPTTLKIMSDYGRERIKRLAGEPGSVSLEDWVVSNFGRKMFDIYFREYSEKVWGIECSRISSEWVAQRIKGLSLTKAVKNAFFKFSGRNIPTLADRFLYPELGIGRISDRLKEEIERANKVLTGTRVDYVSHDGSAINGVGVSNGHYSGFVKGREFISTIPLTNLVRLLRPAPPEDILETASRLKFRDLVVVAVMINRRRVTDQTWIYIPEQKIPFGRIHEPTNWSERMAPDGRTLVVLEYFSFVGDRIWSSDDKELLDMSVGGLEKLGFISKSEVIGGAVVRTPKAYPLFEVGYGALCDKLYDYLARFGNLHVAGRCGMFRYYNMDHAIESGMGAAEKVISGRNSGSDIGHDGAADIASHELQGVAL